MGAHMPSSIPVLTIDGPSGSGKGTISNRIATQLGFHFLDSGALYRLVALAARRDGVALDQPLALASLSQLLDIQFLPDPTSQETEIILDGEVVTDAIRTENCGNDASKVAALAEVRQALLEKQCAFRQFPGLVADGRDMGSVVFPDAQLKIFLTASIEERAQRRYKQLKDKGMDVNLTSLLDELCERDARDSTRQIAPLKPAPDAISVDTTGIGVNDVVAQVLDLWGSVSKRF